MIIFSLTLPVLSAEQTLTGRVMDWNGNGVTDAVVTLTSAHLQTTTDYTGYFTFENASFVQGASRLNGRRFFNSRRRGGGENTAFPVKRRGVCISRDGYGPTKWLTIE